MDAVDMEVEGLVDTVSSIAGLGKLSMADKSKPVPLVSEEGASFMDSANFNFVQRMRKDGLHHGVTLLYVALHLPTFLVSLLVSL